MPSLNDAIKDEEHNPGCFLPEVRRLYIRQGTKGEQKFVHGA